MLTKWAHILYIRLQECEISNTMKTNEGNGPNMQRPFIFFLSFFKDKKKVLYHADVKRMTSHRWGGKKTTVIRTLLVAPSKITPTAWWHGGKCSKRSGRKVKFITDPRHQ